MKDSILNEIYSNGCGAKNSNIVRFDLLVKFTKCICKVNLNGGHGTGFLLKIQIKQKEEKMFYCLISCEHVITKKIIDLEKTIKIYYKNEEKIIYIKLNSNERFIQDFSYLNIDATIVEILPKDNISKEYFLLPNLNPINQLELLLNKKIYILHYPEGGKLCYSYGIIKSIDEYSYIFSYLGGTKSGSSGGPIFLENTSLVIGIHKQRNKNNE